MYVLVSSSIDRIISCKQCSDLYSSSSAIDNVERVLRSRKVRCSPIITLT